MGRIYYTHVKYIEYLGIKNKGIWLRCHQNRNEFNIYYPLLACIFSTTSGLRSYKKLIKDVYIKSQNTAQGSNR